MSPKRLAAMTLAAAAIFGVAQASATIPAAPVQPLLRSSEPTMPPMAFTMFCMKNPAECVGKEKGLPKATSKQQLAKVNAEINARIMPTPQDHTPGREVWEIAPAQGDCNDYAVTKRHKLMQLGWSSRDLLLAVVTTRQGEGHLVVLAKADEKTVVLDNLSADLRQLDETGYQLLKLQSAQDPQQWIAPKSI